MNIKQAKVRIADMYAYIKHSKQIIEAIPCQRIARQSTIGELYDRANQLEYADPNYSPERYNGATALRHFANNMKMAGNECKIDLENLDDYCNRCKHLEGINEMLERWKP